VSSWSPSCHNLGNFLDDPRWVSCAFLSQKLAYDPSRLLERKHLLSISSPSVFAPTGLPTPPIDLNGSQRWYVGQVNPEGPHRMITRQPCDQMRGGGQARIVAPTQLLCPRLERIGPVHRACGLSKRPSTGHSIQRLQEGGVGTADGRLGELGGGHTGWH
jgi:hypothetical protein